MLPIIQAFYDQFFPDGTGKIWRMTHTGKYFCRGRVGFNTRFNRAAQTLPRPASFSRACGRACTLRGFPERHRNVSAAALNLVPA